MHWISLLLMSAISVSALGLSVNMGVAAERMSRAGNKRWQIIAVALSISMGAMALLFAYALGAVIGPR